MPFTDERLADIAGDHVKPSRGEIVAMAEEIKRLRARVLELIPIWNGIEQTRATIESTARLMGEAGHIEERNLMYRWHQELRASLNTRIEP